MSVYLVFLTEKGSSAVEIPKNAEAIVGREETSYRVCVTINGEKYFPEIPEDASVSRKHARLFWLNDKLYIQDVGSLCGTKINNQIIPGWRKRKRTEKGMPSVAIPVIPGTKLLFGAQTLASVETSGNMLTITEGQTVKLPAEVIEHLSKMAELKSINKEGTEVEVANVIQSGNIQSSYGVINVKKEVSWYINTLSDLYKIILAYANKDWNNMRILLDKLRAGNEYIDTIKEVCGEYGETCIDYMNVHVWGKRIEEIEEGVRKELIERLEVIKERLDDEIRRRYKW